MTAPLFNIDIAWRQNGPQAQVAFTLTAGVTALIGPSGAGKTTIARMITGLATPGAGKIAAGEQLLFEGEKGVNIPPAERNIGYVTQEPALFPTMSVMQNIELAAQVSAQDRKSLYNITGITPLLGRDPRTLSGGEARRVSIVRALAAKPRLLILDEPMNGLDPKRRKGLLTLIRRVSYQTQTPALLITHQIEEMLHAADHAVLVANNQTQVSGPIEQVLSAPETASHLGIDDAGAILNTTVTGRTDSLLTAQIGKQTIWLPDDGEEIGSKLRLRILARDVGISAAHLTQVSMLNQLEVRIQGLQAKGHDLLATLAPTGSEQTIEARITQKSATSMKLAEGDTVYALIKAVAVKEMMVN